MHLRLQRNDKILGFQKTVWRIVQVFKNRNIRIALLDAVLNPNSRRFTIRCFREHANCFERLLNGFDVVLNRDASAFLKIPNGT